jgi:hypothetical protein
LRLGLGVAAALVLLAFLTAGGNDLAPNTWVQVGLAVAVAGAALAVLLAGSPGRAWGGLTLLLFAALAALTYASIAWSVQPATSWLEANRTLSYLAAFGAALALARLAPGHWRALVGATATAATAISAYALLTKVFPGTLDPNDNLGRLLAPFGYWNATGLMAAIGIPACLWAGARREQAPVLRALSVPAIAVLVPALLLSYSRGALLAAVLGCGFWFAAAPLRLRAALLLALGAAGGAAIAGWALATHSISADSVPLAARSSAGHAFGLVILVVLVLTGAAGFAAAFALDRANVPPLVRRRIGTALVGLVCLIPVGGVAALAASSRGPTGEISHIWSTLTNPHGVVNDQPGRLVNLSNSRPIYWSQGLTVGEHHLLAGSGALGFATAHLRYTTDTRSVGHAHSYVIETFADFGLIGVAVSLALALAWALAVRRTLELDWPARAVGPRAPPAPDRAAERIGLLTLVAIVLVFAVNSLIDWTWFIPGTAIPAIVCAGWLAGRGPLSQALGRVERRRRLARSPGAALAATTIAALAILAIWVTVQPLRSSDAYWSAVTAVTAGHTAAALTDARSAAADDPVSVDPLVLLSRIYAGLGDGASARQELAKATSLQPSNPQTWQQLGCYDLGRHRSGAGMSELGRAFALEPGQKLIRTDPSAFCAALTT